MLARPPKSPGSKLFQPDFIADSVNDIDFKVLQARGITAVLIDLDGTVVPHGTFDVVKELTDYLKSQKVKIYIATNRSRSKDLKNLKQSLNAGGVIHPAGIFMKPTPQYFKQAAKNYQLKPAEVAMIGDRYVQDIFGANLAGFTTVLVRKLGKPINYFDSLITRFEGKYTDKLAARYVPVTVSSTGGR